MPEQGDIKKALESIVGYELREEELQRFQFFQRVATWDQTDRPGFGFVTSRHILINRKFCHELPLLDVSGGGVTGNGGKMQLRLTDFICLSRISMETPINLIATPLTERPVFLTVLQSLMMDPTNTFGVDVNMVFFTWEAGGAPAPNVPFNWRCRVGFQEPPTG
jgi:hypothetical protein